MPRFAILEHDHPQGKHLDFMLESGGVLKTWAVASWPASGVEIECRILPDHRLAYLDYEGVVSGGRGNVLRIDAGEYVAERCEAAVWIVTLLGQRFAGRVELREMPEKNGVWRLMWQAASE